MGCQLAGGWVAWGSSDASSESSNPPPLHHQAGGLCKYLLELHARHGPIVRIVLGGEVFVSICDTKVCMYVCPFRCLDARALASYIPTAG